jgi:uncharacterized delta-60 repeat protein
MSRPGPVHRRWLTILMILLSASPSAAFAADGDLDPTFGSGGIVVTSFEFFSEILAVAIQPDGKILVGGETGAPGALLARYNPDGSPDLAFQFEPPARAVTDLALQPDGRILAVGAELGGTFDLDVVLIGVEADGDPDFGARTDVSGDQSTDDQAFAIAVQPDGMILVGGSTTLGGGGALVIRYDPIGRLDLGFGTGGIVVTEIAQDGVRVEDLVLQPDGKIVAVVAVPAGEFSGPPLTAFVLIRYNPDGSLDPGFGAGGIASVSLGNPATAAAGVLQPDGRIVVAGTVVVGGVNTMAVARYNADGSLDSTFAGDGLALLDGVEGVGSDITLLADGRILIAGTGLGSDANDFVLARFLGNGSLDASFGTAGRVLTDFPGNSSQEELNAIALQPDGKIVATGSTFSDQTSMALARYLGPAPVVGGEEIPTLDELGLVLLALLLVASAAVILRRRRALGRALSTVLVTGALLSLASPAVAADGDLDPTFGSGGIVVTNFRFFSRIFTVAVQPDGKILVGGETGGPDPAVLVRYNADGSIDPTFLLESLPGLVGARAVRDLTLLPDGRIAAAGRAVGGDDNGFIALWQADGTLDGASVINLLGGEPSDDEAFAVSLQPDGKILVGGGTTLGTGGAFVIRYDSNLNQDPGFGTSGVVVTEIAADGVRIEDLVLQPDGKILAVVAVLGDGVSGPPFSSFTLIRYNADGSVDPAFGHRGFAPGNQATAAAGALQPDGRIVVAGTVVVGGVNRIAVARYDANGSLDPTFAGDGVALLDGVEGVGSDIALLADGRIVVAGTGLGSDANDFLLARFLADGSPDASFGTAGRVFTDVPGNPSQEQLSALALQADGKIVAAGSTSDGVEDMALARYLGPVLGEEIPTLDDLGLGLLALLLLAAAAVILRRRRALGRVLSAALVTGALMSMASPAAAADGDLDPTFGSGGQVITDFGSFDRAVAVALQADGKIVAVGQIDSDIAVVRYNAGGSLDPTFGTGGFVTTNVVSPAGDPGEDVVLLADGRILVVGATDDDDFLLIRYRSDGSLDPTFGSGGIVTTDFTALPGPVRLDGAKAVAVQQDGRILAAGFTFVSGNRDFALARYLANGTLDATFGDGGLVVTDSGSNQDESATSIVVQPDRRILVGGSGDVAGGDQEFRIARYDADGTLDATFGQAGLVATDFINRDEIASLLLLADGRIVAVGQANIIGGQSRFALARYTPSGALDPTFGSGGLTTTNVSPRQDGAFAAALQADGKIVAAGFAETGEPDLAFALVRYTAEGSLDSTFGAGGIVITDFVAGSDDRANAVVIQADGRIVAAGFAVDDLGNGTAFALARYLNAFGAIVAIPTVGDLGLVLLALLLLASATVILRRRRTLGRVLSAALVAGALMSIASPAVAADGDLDPTFGSGGRVITDFGSFDRALAALQADGKIVAAGQIDDRVAVVRYNADGSLDPTFGTGGFVTTDVGSAGGDRAEDVVVLADGRILVVGTADNEDFMLVRYQSSGSLDPSFGSGGIVTTDFSVFSGLDPVDEAAAVAVQQNGRILAAGVAGEGGLGSAAIALARYLPDGALDATFGTGGLVVTDLQSNEDERASSLVVQPDGRVVVGGASPTVGQGSFADFVIVRYDSDGTLDPTFGQAGVATSDFGNGEDDEVAALLLLPDGRVVAAGRASFSGQTRFALARYTTSGALDPTFGSGGLVNTDLFGQNNQEGALDAALQADGKVVAAGFAETGNGDVAFALLRYTSQGSLDPSFGAGGIVITDFLAGLDDRASGVVLQPDGRIVAAGFAGDNLANGPAFALARYQNALGAVAIPTAGGIGLVLLALLLLASATVILRRRRALDEN